MKLSLQFFFWGLRWSVRKGFIDILNELLDRDCDQREIDIEQLLRLSKQRNDGRKIYTKLCNYFYKKQHYYFNLSEKRVIQKFIIEENLQELINQDPYFDYSINNNYILRETSNPNFLTVLSCTK